MKYNLPWLISEYEKLQKQDKNFDYLFFWGHRPTKDGSLSKTIFSQWWQKGFSVDGIIYPTAEHFMMAGKARLFEDEEMLEQILKAQTPAEAKKLGRKVINFDDTLWQEKRSEIVVEGNYHKFLDADYKAFLLGTGNKIIVEASPSDRIWGIGMKQDAQGICNPKNWKGLNLLGFALMEVREKLRNEG
ncbi:NADAR family protein [Bernardetia sp.]|uniref:NADAR family protein n=1 Tax=Bernardetia sp. TaxID=1937974 RepID=UPI0025C18A40|nr:NADAR family protein [Bernardetia sp.]